MVKLIKRMIIKYHNTSINISYLIDCMYYVNSNGDYTNGSYIICKDDLSLEHEDFKKQNPFVY